VLCGSSYKNKGIQQMLDAVVDYLPAPTDVEAIATVDQDGNPNGQRICSDDEPFSALAFKVINDAYGALTFVRVYSGVLAKGASVQNTTRGKREKIGRMVEMFAKEANAIEEARAGDIIALVSLAETDTGDTLCDSNAPVILERMRFPEPVISVSVRPKNKGELEKFGASLGKMVPTPSSPMPRRQRLRAPDPLPLPCRRKDPSSGPFCFSLLSDPGRHIGTSGTRMLQAA
jgi:elongation factor G